jgi:acetyl esterase
MNTHAPMNTPTSSGVVEVDVDYVHHDGVPLVGRLYRPTGTGPFPTVVNVHGGTWVGGTRRSNEPTSRMLAAAGHLVFAPEFRMPPVARYPQPVADINAAVRWLKGAAPDYGGSSRVAGIGFSSGGHQLMLVAMRPHDPRYASVSLPRNEHDATLSAIVLCYAVLDPSTRYAMAEATGRTDLTRGHIAYWPDEPAAAEGNPQHILDRGEHVTLPPALVIQGDVDTNLTREMAADFGTAYRRAGGSADVIRYPQAQHGFLRKDPDSADARDANVRIIRFLAAHATTDRDARP